MLDREILDKLQEFAEYELTEMGEACSFLLQLYRYSDYLTDEFVESLENEILYKLSFFSLHAKFVEKEITTTRTIKELEWDDYYE